MKDQSLETREWLKCPGRNWSIKYLGYVKDEMGTELLALLEGQVKLD